MSAAALLFGCKLPTSGGDKNNQDNGGTITTPGGNSQTGGGTSGSSGGQTGGSGSGGQTGGGGTGSGGHTGGGNGQTGGGGSGGGSGSGSGGGSGEGGQSGGSAVVPLQILNTNWSGKNGDEKAELFFAVTGNTVDIELSSDTPNSNGSIKLTASYTISGSKVSFNINTFDSWKNIKTADDFINVMKSAEEGRISRFKAKIANTTDASLKA